MRNFSLMLKLTLIVGIIGLLNFTNFDLGSNTSLNNSLATENTQSQEATLIENASNPDSTQSKEIYTVQKANFEATDSFDPDAIPYFRTQTVPASAAASTITIRNHWNDNISAEIKSASNGSTLTSTLIDNCLSETLTYTPDESVYLVVTASNKDGFRSWCNAPESFIRVSGDSTSQFESFTYIPDMRYFTTEKSGTEAGPYFFNWFFYDTEVTTLPEGSFDTSYIKTASYNFFSAFNYFGSITSLPKGSFNFDALETLQDSSFTDFNSVGALASLPYNSFNTSSVTIGGSYQSRDFNWSGKLTRCSYGVHLRNTTSGTRWFYWAENSEFSSSSLQLPSGDTFTAYAMDVVLSFNSQGGSTVDSIDGITCEKFAQPSNPTKSGYKFIQWVYKDGTVYDWDSTATDNLTLYAEWEEVPSPTPTTSPTNSPTSSPTPTKSPTSSPSPSSSNSLPVTGDDSWNIFTFGSISLFMGMIMLTLTLVNRRSKRITNQENYKGKLKE